MALNVQMSPSKRRSAVTISWQMMHTAVRSSAVVSLSFGYFGQAQWWASTASRLPQSWHFPSERAKACARAAR